jgi:hypothetical protein
MKSTEIAHRTIHKSLTCQLQFELLIKPTYQMLNTGDNTEERFRFIHISIALFFFFYKRHFSSHFKANGMKKIYPVISEQVVAAITIKKCKLWGSHSDLNWGTRNF